MRVLVVDDDPPSLKMTAFLLSEEGYEVATADNGLDALRLVEQQAPDLVILDVMMPQVDGFDVCREIRAHSDVPIIMLTALDSTDDMVRGFELGADDYIAKPFSFKEVQARIHAILRRNQWIQDRRQPTVFENGWITLDVAAQQVLINGEPIHLTPIEFKLLFTLIANAGKVMSKNDLFLDVWGYEFIGGTNLVEVTVCRLREKVEPDPSQPYYILTVRGTGYRFRRASE